MRCIYTPDWDWGKLSLQHVHIRLFLRGFFLSIAQINATKVREDKAGIRMTWRSGNLNKKAQKKR